MGAFRHRFGWNALWQISAGMACPTIFRGALGYSGLDQPTVSGAGSVAYLPAGKTYIERKGGIVGRSLDDNLAILSDEFGFVALASLWAGDERHLRPCLGPQFRQPEERTEMVADDHSRVDFRFVCVDEALHSAGSSFALRTARDNSNVAR